MKKLLRKILLILGAIIILIILFFLYYGIRGNSARKKMTPAVTSQITDDVFAVKDKYVNMYLIRDGDNFIAVDAGITKGNVKDELKKLDIDPYKVKAVFLTHSDGDHVGGLKLFNKADVYLPEEEEQVINGETGRFLWFGNKIDAKDYKLVDDDIIKIGDIKIHPVPTPGHTPGSTCYQINDKYLFTGDALRLYNGSIVLFPKFINKSARRARKSVSNITDLDDVQYIFSAHYGYTGDYKAAVSHWK